MDSKELLNYVIGTIIILFVFFIANIWITTLYLDSTYKFNKALKKNIILKKENEKLKAEVKFLSSPERIIKIAKNKLKMRFVKNNEVIVVDY